METTDAVLDALAQSGADAVELGIPYGDPLADGPTVAAAGARALRGNVGVEQVFDLLRERAHRLPPIVLFTYFNPVYRYGVERFARDAAAAGAAGVIVPDIALEEGHELRRALEANVLQMPLLVAPSTPIERAALVTARSTGFVYVVSRLGVTGAAAAPDFGPLQRQVTALRRVTDKPLVVGFGISTAHHVREVRGLVDGIAVGSAVIDAYAGTRGAEAAARVAAFARGLLEGTR